MASPSRTSRPSTMARRPSLRASAVTIPPKNPSHDFAGEIEGAILCLPKRVPTKNAPMSSSAVIRTNATSSREPIDVDLEDRDRSGPPTADPCDGEQRPRDVRRRRLPAVRVAARGGRPPGASRASTTAMNRGSSMKAPDNIPRRRQGPMRSPACDPSAPARPELEQRQQDDRAARTKNAVTPST